MFSLAGAKVINAGMALSELDVCEWAYSSLYCQPYIAIMSLENTSSKLETIRFHVFSLKLTPFARFADEHNTNGILNSVFIHTNKEKTEGRAVIVDRNRNREGSEERAMFLVSASKAHKEKCFKCSLALLKPGRKLKVKKAGEMTLEDYDTSIGDIAVETHFFINYTKENAIICVEFNSEGPRFSDIAYYLLAVAKGSPLNLAKSATFTCYMNKPIDKTLAELKDVLSIEMRVKPSKLSQLEPRLQADYFSGMTNLGQKINPSWIKIQASFVSPGNKVKSKELDNPEARNMAKRLISVFKDAPEDLDVFESFEVSYKDKDGTDSVFNLLSGKQTFEVNTEWSNLKNSWDWYALIKTEFEDFVSTL